MKLEARLWCSVFCIQIMVLLICVVLVNGLLKYIGLLICSKNRNYLTRLLNDFLSTIYFQFTCLQTHTYLCLTGGPVCSRPDLVPCWYT